MAKFTGLAEQYDGGREIYVQQEGDHVTLSVEATQDDNKGTALVTPSMARAISAELLREAEHAENWIGN